MNECIHKQTGHRLQMKSLVSVLNVKPNNLFPITKSSCQWPKCTTLLFCFYNKSRALTGFSAPCSLQQGFEIKYSKLLYLPTTEPTETQKLQVCQTKLEETRGKQSFSGGIKRDRRSGHRGKAFIFQRRTNKVNKRYAVSFLFFFQCNVQVLVLFNVDYKK